MWSPVVVVVAIVVVVVVMGVIVAVGMVVDTSEGGASVNVDEEEVDTTDVSVAAISNPTIRPLRNLI